MSLSEQLSKLSARTRELEQHASAARTKAHSELEGEVQAAREASRASAKALQESAAADAAEVSAWWTGVGRSWDQHVSRMREQLDEKKAEHDVKAAKRDADEAYEYAAYLIDYVYAAVQEADYAVLDATLAQRDYDELAAAQSAAQSGQEVKPR